MVANWIWAAGVAVVSAAQAFGAWIMGLVRFGGALLFNGLVVAGWVANLLIALGTWFAGWVASVGSMAIAAAPVLLPMLAIVAAVTAIIAVIYVLLDNWKNVFDIIAGIATGNWDRIAKGFYGMVEKLKGYWNSFKSFFGMKVETTVGANSDASVAKQDNSAIQPALRYQPSMPSVAPAVAASAAVSSGGVVPVTQSASQSVVINQNLPPGTSAETAQAARDATQRAIDSAFDVGRLSRQMGQVGG
jgi:hypothetical protein